MKKYTLLAFFSFGLITGLYAQSWSLTGNSGTTAPANFLGTKDNQSLVFKTNNKEQLRITAAGRIGIGIAAPSQRLDVNGNINLAKGFGLYIDNHPVLRIDSAYANLFLGNGAGRNNTSNSNIGIGSQALFLNTAGGYNTAIGVQSLYNNRTGYENTATGDNTLSNNTGGYQNIANGNYALYFNSTGSSNTATGYLALYRNTTGSNNTSYGSRALYGNTDGSQNVSIGDWSLYNTTAAWGNTAVGYNAGSSRNNGYNNTFIGSFTDAASNDIYNSTTLGNYAYATESNQVRIGNSFVNSIGGYANWTNISDGRVKKNIKQNVPGLAFINKLKPVTYNLNLDAADKILQLPAVKDKDGKLIMPSQEDINARNAKQHILYTGFVAQEVEKAAKEIGYDFSGVDAAKSDKNLYGLRYAEFVVPLVKAVQELSQKVEKLEAQINAQPSAAIHQQSAAGNGDTKMAASAATLEQNVPNPFTRTTTIHYTLPQQFSAAKIILTDKWGRIIKEVKASGTGNNSLTVDASTLTSGTYQYSLIVDGKLIATKQMITTK